MSTVYTYCIEDGTVTELSEFAMNCAKAFGALISMRDEPSDKEVPQVFEPSTYHKEALATAGSELIEFLTQSNEKLKKEWEDQYEDSKQSHKDYVQRLEDKKFNYQCMLLKVKEWTPPTDEHIGLKDFMLSQLNDSIKHDCEGYAPTKPVKQEFEKWLADKTKILEEKVEYHEKEWKAEQFRCAERTDWVKQLRDSFPEK